MATYLICVQNMTVSQSHQVRDSYVDSYEVIFAMKYGFRSLGIWVSIPIIKHTLARNCPVSLDEVPSLLSVNVDLVALRVIVYPIKFSALPNKGKLFLCFSAF